MVILAQGREEVVDVEVLFVNGDGTLRHFSAVFITHKLVERVETRHDIPVRPHPVKEHGQRGTKLPGFSLRNLVILGLPQSHQQCLYGILLLHIENAVICPERIE